MHSKKVDSLQNNKTRNYKTGQLSLGTNKMVNTKEIMITIIIKI